MKDTSFGPADISAMVEKGSTAAIETVERTMERLLEIASVKAVYDSPVQHGDKLIIPAAEVLGGLGFGVGTGIGTGENPGKRDEEQEGESAEKETPDATPKSGAARKYEGAGGGGGGGGGQVIARPVAVIISGPDGVRVEPVVDATKIALAFFTALGFMVGMASRMRRFPRSQE